MKSGLIKEGNEGVDEGKESHTLLNFERLF